MLSGVFKYVKDMPLEMIHPWEQSETINAKFSGETDKGLAHGLGEFTWDEGRGFG